METMECVDIEGDRKDIELGYIGVETEDVDLDDLGRKEIMETIQLSKEKGYHLSDVNLLSPSYAHKKEELEISHTLEEHMVIEILASKIFKEWDISADGVISSEDITDSGFDREFGEALGRVLDCDKSGQIVREGLELLSCLVATAMLTTWYRLGQLSDNINLRNNEIESGITDKLHGPK